MRTGLTLPIFDSLADPALLAAWARHPLLTLKVVAGIHWEALKLWRKGVKYRPKPHGRMRLEPAVEAAAEEAAAYEKVLEIDPTHAAAHIR